MKDADLVRDAVQELVRERSAGLLEVVSVERQRRAELYSSVQEALASWKKSRECIVTGCDDPSIQRSHAIQEAGPLQHVAEKHFVLSPGLELGGLERTMRKITLATASTFPGFCSRHEQLFHRFERRRQLGERMDFILQAYRATCREVVRLRHEYSHIRRNLQSIREAIHNFLESEIIKRIRARGIEVDPSAIDKILSATPLHEGEDKVDELLEVARIDLETLENGHLKCMEHAIFGAVPTDLAVRAVKLPAEIPVCLSGLDCLRFQERGEHRRVLVILNVIPEPGHTYLIAFVRPEDRDYLDPYLDTVETLLAGTDCA